MSNTTEPEKPTSKENKPVSKPSFLAEDAAAIEMTSESGAQRIEKVDPALRPTINRGMIEGEKSHPSHPNTPPRSPHYDDRGFLHEG